MIDNRVSEFWKVLKSYGFEGTRITPNLQVTQALDAMAMTWLQYGPVGLNMATQDIVDICLVSARHALNMTQKTLSEDRTHFIYFLYQKRVTTTKQIIARALGLASLELSIDSNSKKTETAERLFSTVQYRSIGRFFNIRTRSTLGS